MSRPTLSLPLLSEQRRRRQLLILCFSQNNGRLNNGEGGGGGTAASVQSSRKNWPAPMSGLVRNLLETSRPLQPKQQQQQRPICLDLGRGQDIEDAPQYLASYHCHLLARGGRSLWPASDWPLRLRLRLYLCLGGEVLPKHRAEHAGTISASACLCLSSGLISQAGHRYASPHYHSLGLTFKRSERTRLVVQRKQSFRPASSA